MKMKRPFDIEVFYAKWEFNVRHNISSTDMQSMSLGQLLALGGPGAPDSFKRVHLGYTEPSGHPDLREALAATFETLGSRHVLCCAAAEECIFCLMNVLLDANDHAIVVAPNYQSTETVPASICEVSAPALDEANDWALDIAEIERAMRRNTKLVYVNFPNNPTGKLISREELESLVELCRTRGIRLVSDEIFRGSEMDPARRLPPVADLYELGYSLGGISKVYGLAGLRTGWIASQDVESLQEIERFKHFTTICSSAPSEFLATIAVRARETLFERTNGFKKTQLAHFDRFFQRHEDLFEWKIPDAGTFAYPRYRGPGDVESLCASLLAETGVLVLPPRLFKSDFTPLPKDRFRVGFTRPDTEQALDLFEQHLLDKGLA